jgi:hypothetical protein
MRVPSLRARATAWWGAERQEGEWIREDPGVQRVADALGLGFRERDSENDSGGGTENTENTEGNKGEGKLRAAAKMAVKSLLAAFVPSQYWTGAFN